MWPFLLLFEGIERRTAVQELRRLAADTPLIRDEQVPDAKIDQRGVSNLAGLEQLGHPGGSDGFRLF